MPYIRKVPFSELADEFRPWAPARFQTEGARDEFLHAVERTSNDAWGAEATVGDVLGARVRWRRGSFLCLNDLAYAFGGRIRVGVVAAAGPGPPRR